MSTLPFGAGTSRSKPSSRPSSRASSDASRRGGRGPRDGRRDAARESRADGRGQRSALGATRVARERTGGGARERLSGVRDRIASLGRAGKVALAAAAVLVVVVLALYAPACQLWAAWRTQGASQATLDELSASNEDYQSDIERLQTREGIEDEARKKGYVAEGETGVVVEGLPSEDGADDTSDTAETPWYVQFGDVIFQYHES